MLDEPTNTKWHGNIFYGAELGIAQPEGVSVVDPQLRLGDDGLYRPGIASPAVGAALGAFPFTEEDIDGQPRGKQQDVGCDQRSTQPVLRRPLTSANAPPELAEPR